MREGSGLFQAGRYHEALQRFYAARAVAVEARMQSQVARALGNIGGCQFALHQYRPALQSYLEAHRHAEAANDRSAAAILDVNIASLYSELGELDAASEWIQGTIRRLNAEDRKFLPKILIQLATLRARQDRMAEARQLFNEGIEAADRAGDLTLYAIGWNRLGEEYLKRGELALAEAALLEAYRIRKLNHLALDSSYRSLGRLRLEQGDLTSAAALLDRAVELSAQPQGGIPTWDIYHYRGRVRMAQGRLRDAMADLRIAVRLARDWRWNTPPDDTSRMGTEGWLELVYSALVEAGNRLYLETGEPALIRETFEAAEENRASSLRAVFSRGRTPDASGLPPAYWETLARLQRAEVQALRAPDAHIQETVAGVRSELVRMELALGPAVAPLPSSLLERTRRTLDGDSALLSFQLGDRISWLWALDGEGLALYTLPARAEVESQANAAATAMREDAGAGAAGPARLWRTLFGQLPARIQHKIRWLVALDRGSTLTDSHGRFTAGGLPFEAPLAALQDSSRQPAAYLAERHVIEIIPGAGYWVEARSRTGETPAPIFVGVGDPIYNTADPRLPPLAPGAGPAPKPALMLPRLVGSGAELDACARNWQGERVLLKGAAASRASLAEQLRRNPAVVHLATHVLESSERPSYGLIALSLTVRRESELLPPYEIAGWRTNAGLVVLSGCHSAEGVKLPGTGLLGLTRAWLMAGAHSVISSNWDTPDESGALFGALYRNLSEESGSSPAAALRAAQLEMIRSGSWRAKPSYWGAYFVVGSQ
ncbi:MAG: CHAT domain-containing protein [Candidatus Solibacter sp.]|nr:CHAT domain-containing protein [Candidatus Solibacter sp.]